MMCSFSSSWITNSFNQHLQLCDDLFKWNNQIIYYTSLDYNLYQKIIKTRLIFILYFAAVNGFFSSIFWWMNERCTVHIISTKVVPTSTYKRLLILFGVFFWGNLNTMRTYVIMAFWLSILFIQMKIFLNVLFCFYLLF